MLLTPLAKQSISSTTDDPAQELAHAHSNFAWMFVRAKRFDKAEQLYDEIGFGPEDKPYCWSLVARCEIALHRENFDRATQWVQLGLEDALPAAKLSSRSKEAVERHVLPASVTMPLCQGRICQSRIRLRKSN